MERASYVKNLQSKKSVIAQIDVCCRQSRSPLSKLKDDPTIAAISHYVGLCSYFIPVVVARFGVSYGLIGTLGVIVSNPYLSHSGLRDPLSFISAILLRITQKSAV